VNDRYTSPTRLEIGVVGIAFEIKTDGNVEKMQQRAVTLGDVVDLGDAPRRAQPVALDVAERFQELLERGATQRAIRGGRLLRRSACQRHREHRKAGQRAGAAQQVAARNGQFSGFHGICGCGITHDTFLVIFGFGYFLSGVKYLWRYWHAAGNFGMVFFV
jgi:hypothetical protein